MGRKEGFVMYRVNGAHLLSWQKLNSLTLKLVRYAPMAVLYRVAPSKSLARKLILRVEKVSWPSTVAALRTGSGIAVGKTPRK
jgi:hypothetical protein